MQTEILKKQLNEKLGSEFDVKIFESIDSTNDYCKKIAHERLSESAPAKNNIRIINAQNKACLLAIALSQTAGKGQFNKSFYSPKNSGIYFSLMLENFDMCANRLENLTVDISNVCSKVINETQNLNTQVKPLNDIFLDDKKVAGILCEIVANSNLSFLIIGIGINLSMPKCGFPSEIIDTAGFLQKEKVSEKNCANLLSKICMEILASIY
ncbi:MAG: biotin--[acetyl-CoA-carboxylase] ligase [Coriobacteriales bacterium]|nr:biotin--[acetyl-CoA-carboxylase] ligase [Coriobacteriales bacterium]